MKIRTKFLLMILVILSIGAAISMVWISYSSNRNTMLQTITSNDYFSGSIYETVYLLMKTGQQDSLNAYLDQMRKFKYIAEVKVIGADTKTVSGLAKDDLARQVLSSGRKVVKEVAVNHLKAIRAIVPIIADRSCLACHTDFKDGQTAAALSAVFVYQSTLDQMFRDLVKNAYIQFFIFMLVAGLILLFFNVLIISPLDRMRAFASKLGKGDWTAVADLKKIGGQEFQKGGGFHSLDEVRDLAVSFYEMSQNLQVLTVSRNELFNEVNERKQVEEKLRFSEEYLSKVMDSVIDPIFVKDRQHRWVLFNKAYCLFMGRSRDEIMLKSDYDFFPKEEADVFWAKDEDVFRSGIDNENEEFFTDGKGIRKTIITKKTLYKNAEGKEYIVASIQDITEIKKTQDDLRLQARELKVFYDASIGREERILELKKEVERLKSEMEILKKETGK
ncbi:MAG: PAS domain S-box protein [Candidatus Omnitrophica bacterium]|nr:PAS domain S-box protein [Candidatus Omnitrophota bacterium]